MPNFEPSKMADMEMPAPAASGEEEYDLFEGEEGAEGGSTADLISQLAALDDASLAEVADAIAEEQASREGGGEDELGEDLGDDLDLDEGSDEELYA